MILSAGEIRLTRSLDYEAVTSYNLTVEVSDGVLTTPDILTVDIQDVDEAPIISGIYSYKIYTKCLQYIFKSSCRTEFLLTPF